MTIFHIQYNFEYGSKWYTYIIIMCPILIRIQMRIVICDVRICVTPPGAMFCRNRLATSEVECISRSIAVIVYDNRSAPHSVARAVTVHLTVHVYNKACTRALKTTFTCQFDQEREENVRLAMRGPLAVIWESDQSVNITCWM